MPYPLAIAALAVSAAGAGAQMAAQSKVRSAEKRATNAEMQRQAGYRNQAAQVVNQSIADSDVTEARDSMAENAAERAAAYNRITGQVQKQVSAVPQPRIINPTSGTGTAGNPYAANAAAWNRIIGGAQSKLGGYNDWGLDRGMKLSRGNQDIGLIGNQAAGSSRVLQAELQDAQHEGDALAAGGQVLSAVGALGGAVAATSPTVARLAQAGVQGIDYTPQMVEWGTPLIA